MVDKPKDRAARRVRYTGSVQGVGFRATALSIAWSFPITGWVRNLSDGSVELWVEGSEAQVREFLQAVRGYWGDSIEDEQIEERDPVGHARFQVQH